MGGVGPVYFSAANKAAAITNTNAILQRIVILFSPVRPALCWGAGNRRGSLNRIEKSVHVVRAEENCPRAGDYEHFVVPIGHVRGEFAKLGGTEKAVVSKKSAAAKEADRAARVIRRGSPHFASVVQGNARPTGQAPHYNRAIGDDVAARRVRVRHQDQH